MSLAKKLKNWVDNNLISAEQSSAIQAFETRSNGSLFYKISFSIVGLLIGLGICLIIASNWDEIPVLMRLIGAFGIFAIFIAGACSELQKPQSKLKEMFLVLCFLMVAALIGLIGQTFNLDGGWHSFSTAWAILSLPYVFRSRLRLLNMAWICVLLSSMFTGIFWHWLVTVFPWILLIDFEDYVIPLTLAIVVFLTLLSWVMHKIDTYVHKQTVLAESCSLLCTFFAYYTVFCCGFYYMGSYHFRNGNGVIVLIAHILVLAYLAFRMYLAVRKQEASAFKRNAFMAEIYIFLIFANCFGNLFATGIGFILGGLLIWGLIHVLKKTSKYIKGMEIFNE